MAARRSAVLAACAIGLGSGVAAAQSNPGATPLGGRSTLAGGTGVALSRDGSAPFLNPATMSSIADTRVAFSVHAYQASLTKVDDFFQPLPAGPEFYDASIARRKFSTVPSTFCAFVTLAGIIPEESSGLLATVRGSSGRTKLGICGASIEREDFELSAEGTSRVGRQGTSAVAYSVRRTWRRFSIGPSLSYQLTDRLSVGASWHTVITSARLSWDANAMFLDDDSSTFTTFSDQARGDSVDGSTTLGVTYAHGRQTFGLSTRVPAVHAWGEARASRFVAAPEQPAQLALSTGSFKALPPPTVALGSGVEWDQVTLEVDAVHTFGSTGQIESRLDTETYDLRDPEGRPSHAVTRERTRSTTSFRVGTEWALSPTLGLVGGARVDPSAVYGPIADARPRFAQARTHQVAGSLGIGSYGSGTELLIGGQLSYQWGKTLVCAPSGPGVSYGVTNQRSYAFLLVLSGSVNLRTITRAVEDLGELGRQTVQPTR
jgi:hypothetical protein